MLRALAGTCLIVALGTLAVAGGPAWAPAWAEDPYPTRPVSMVVAFPPGGLADNTARPVATALERILKQPVAIINKAGAAGAVGNQTVATSKPDGYTLLMALVSISVLPEVDKLFGRPYRRLPSACMPHHREEHRRHERHFEKLAPELDPLEGVDKNRRAGRDEDRAEHERGHLRPPDAEAIEERQADPDEVERDRLPARPCDHYRDVRRGERDPRNLDEVLTQPVDSPHGEQSRSGPPARASSAAA